MLISVDKMNNTPSVIYYLPVTEFLTFHNPLITGNKLREGTLNLTKV